MKYDDELLATLEEFPRFRIKFKHESWFMKLLNVLLLIVTFGQQRGFMTRFITTIGRYMWVPRDWGEWNDKGRALILRHERVHMRQQESLGMVVYVLTYLLWPIPILWANGRTELEMDAYEETLRGFYEYFGAAALRDPELRKSIIKHFTSGDYAWMWVGRRRIERWYDDAIARILDR
jgi:hypothetical protein